MRFFELNQIVQIASPERLRLRWDHNTDSFRSWLMSEVTSQIAKELESWKDENPEELPFNGIFHSKEEEPITRTVIPFIGNPDALNILDKISKSGLSLDFENGTVTDGKRSTRLGKFVLNKNSSFSETEKKWWNHSGDPVSELKRSKTAHEYAIIVSRHPIDIARMSDHDGWTSCHAPSGSYFNCAIADAKGSGAIAYVVEKSDLNNIDLQSPEIFKDKHRGVSGVSPISRVRIRKFVHKEEGYDLAVPEDRTYGKTFPGLTDSIRDWALKSQQSVLKGKRVSMDEFKLMGGSYQDTRGSHLFNHFFGDDIDSGDVEYGGEDDNGQAMFDQYEEEVGIIENEFRNSFTICGYYASVEESDNEPYVFIGGYAFIEIPENLSLLDRKADRSLRNILEKWAKNNDYVTMYTTDVEIEDNKIRFDLESDEDPTPDGLRDFIENTLTDIEKNKDNLESSLYQELVNNGAAMANKITQIRHDINDSPDDHEHSFQNFEWDVDDHEISISLKKPLKFPFKISYENGYKRENDYNEIFLSKSFKSLLTQKIKNWTDGIIKANRDQLNLFPDIEKKLPFEQFQMHLVPEIQIRQNEIRMKLVFQTFTEDEHVEDSIKLTNFLDKNFDKFVDIIYRLVYSELPDQTIPKTIPQPQKQAQAQAQAQAQPQAQVQAQDNPVSSNLQNQEI